MKNETIKTENQSKNIAEITDRKKWTKPEIVIMTVDDTEAAGVGTTTDGHLFS